MNLAGLPPGEITSNVYPAPPRVSWLVLLIASCVFDALAEELLSKPYSQWMVGLLVNGWAVYFCFWLRKLDRRASNVTWCIAATAAAVLAEIIGDLTPDTSWLRFLAFGLMIIGLAMYLLLTFTLRSTLLYHYNEREPVGLKLSPWMTLFFSFYYFQYHLYPIAQFKDRVARDDMANPGRSLLS